jgi:hypothetical protein
MDRLDQLGVSSVRVPLERLITELACVQGSVKKARPMAKIPRWGTQKPPSWACWPIGPGAAIS